MKLLIFIMLAFTAFFPEGAKGQVDLNFGLELYYPFNGNANDESGNGNNGSVLGATLTTNRIGNANSAYYFDGAGDYINTNITPNRIFSISIWYYKNTAQNENAGLLSTYSGGFNYSGVYYAMNEWTDWIRCDGNSLDAFNTSALTWKHIVIVSDGSRVKVYENANIRLDFSGTTNHSNQLVIGDSRYNGRYFKGKIDNVHVYNRAITNEEVRALFELGETGMFRVTNIYPTRGGNTGAVSIYIHGEQFVDGTTVKLVRGSEEIIGNSVSVNKDGHTIKATFDLRKRAQGLWDVDVTNPEGSTISLQGRFMIEEGVSANFWIDIVGLDRIRIGRKQNYWITVGNSGNIDSRFVYALLQLPESITYELDISPGFPIDPNATKSTDGTQFFAIGIPSIPAQSTVSIPIRLSTEQRTTHSLFGGIFNPYTGRSDQSLNPTSTDTYPPFWDWRTRGAPPPGYIVMYNDFGGSASTGVSLGDGRVSHFLREGAVPGGLNGLNVHPYDIVEPTHIVRPPDWTLEKAQKRVADFFEKWQEGTNIYDGKETSYYNKWPKKNFPDLNCAGWDYFFWPELRNLPYDTISDIVGELYDRLYWYWYGEGFFNLKYDWKHPGWLDWISGDLASFLDKLKDIIGIGSFDPNDKAGPQGFEAKGFLRGSEPLRYTIFFENIETATASAQEVIVTDQLDPAIVDINTLSLGPITFGNFLIEPPLWLDEFTTSIDLRPSINIIVRINTQFNSSTGLLSWHLLSLDPSTGQPPEIVGFLPPNRTPPEGEGSVSFTIYPRDKLSTGTEVLNQAKITFDTNPPIVTKQWRNIIDNSPPTGRMLALDSLQKNLTFDVRWRGSDIGSGIRDYSIYVSQNEGPFDAWLMNTTDTTATFSGEANNRYDFYCVSRDVAGNMEVNSLQAEATTFVADMKEPPKTFALYQNYPNPFNAGTTIKYEVTKTVHVTIKVYDLIGREIKVLVNEAKSPGRYEIKWEPKEQASGIYFYRMQAGEFDKSKKFILL